MEQIIIDQKEEITMNLVHYFIAEKNYNPVIVHGIKDEIWLENMDSDYKLVRIVLKYIHNNEQLNYDRFRYKQIARRLKSKTLSLKMNVLNLYIDLGDSVSNLDNDGTENSVFVRDISDVNNEIITTTFTDIVEKTKHKEKGIELILKMTNDINKKNESKNKKMDKIFSKKKPIVTYTIIALCIIMFFISGLGYDNNLLFNLGALYGPYVRNGEIYRLITSMFLHAGIIHIVFNIYSLYIVGSKIEDFFGKWKYILIYLISGISGGLLSIMLNQEALSVGASGAIFGLFGALLYFGYTYRGYIGTIIKSQILPIVIYNLLMGFLISGIDNWAHIGGLVGGLITAYTLGTIDNKEYEVNRILLLFTYLAFLIYMVFFR